MDGSQIEKSFMRIHGLKLPKVPEVLSAEMRTALRNNRYAPEMTNAALQLVQHGDRVLQVGARLGVVAARLAQDKRLADLHLVVTNPHFVDYARLVLSVNGVENAQVSHGVLAAGDAAQPFFVRPLPETSSVFDIPGTHVDARIDLPAQRGAMVLEETRPDVMLMDLAGTVPGLFDALDLSAVREVAVLLRSSWTGQTGSAAVCRACISAGLCYYPRTSCGDLIVFRRHW